MNQIDVKVLLNMIGSLNDRIAILEEKIIKLQGSVSTTSVENAEVTNERMADIENAICELSESEV